MEDPTSPTPTPSADDMHWVLYLREDLQEIRQDVRALSVEIRQDLRLIHGRVDETNRRIDDTNRRIDSRFALLLMTMITLFGMTIAFLEYRLPVV